jgi:hypothetical protein
MDEIDRELVFPKIFIVESFNDAIKKGQALPPLKEMFSNLIYENTVNIWFGDNATAKTLTAMMTADSFAEGVKPFNEFNNEVPPHDVYYNDYELTERQLSKRYEGLEFSDRLKRISIDFTKNLEGINIGKLLIKDCERKQLEKHIITAHLTVNLNIPY